METKVARRSPRKPEQKRGGGRERESELESPNKGGLSSRPREERTMTAGQFVVPNRISGPERSQAQKSEKEKESRSEEPWETTQNERDKRLQGFEREVGKFCAP